MGEGTERAISVSLQRAGLIGVMLAGGLLYAGISQAQDAGAADERAAELVAASGGPAPSTHLITFETDKAAVEVRDDDVAPAADTAASAAADRQGELVHPVSLNDEAGGRVRAAAPDR